MAGRILKRLFSDTDGAALPEAAIALPIILALSIGGIYVGWEIWTLSTLNLVVERTARCVAVNTSACGSVSDARNYAVAESARYSAPFTSANFPAAGIYLSTTCTGASPQNCARVTGSYVFNLTIPFLFNSAPTLSLTAEYPTIH
jgi:Flp pilus assembly protein TadG